VSELPLVVIGHKNPDTDSVCAAIGYARYKRLADGIEATAYRAGNLNAQTAFALASFETTAPELLTDVYPRIRDIMIPYDALILIRPDDPIERAREIMLENRFSFLPVVGTDGSCTGKVTLRKLAALLDDIPPHDPTVTVDPETLCSRLRPVKGADGVPLPPGPINARLAPISTTTPGQRNGPHATDLLVGPWSELRELPKPRGQLAVAAACQGTEASAIAAWSKAHGLPIIATGAELPAVWIAIRLSMDVQSCIEAVGPTFAADDRLADVGREVNRSNEGGFIVLDDEQRIAGVVTRVNFMTDARFRVVLVDHNELSQSVDGMADAAIVEIIDHHRIGGRSTSEPITFVNHAVGSTCTIVASLYRSAGVTPDPPTAGLLLSGVLSDTVVLRSPTTTARDREVAEWLCGLAGVDLQEYGERMFEAGSTLQAATPREVLEQDMKYYDEHGEQFSVSQIEMVGWKAFWDRSDEIVSELGAHVARAGLGFACLMVTDITHASTLLVTAGESRIVSRISYPEVRPGIFEMKEVLSRKKQVLPYLLELTESP
jgi:manganese-dependent inorganic pyrophosphatase